MRIKQHRLLTALFAAILLFLISRYSATAADVTITCSDLGSCDMGPTSNAALFKNYNRLPGDSIMRELEVVNNNSSDDCSLTLDTKNETETAVSFSPQWFTVIKNGGKDVYGARSGSDDAASDKTLKNLFDAGAISLGTIAAGSTVTYEWVVTFDSSADDTYQSAEVLFDFDAVFECGEEPATTLTSTSGGGSGGDGRSTATCTATAPETAPVLSVITTGANSATLAWTSVSPVTHYMIVYGTTSGSPSFGADNVGNVQNYTILGLSGGETYYFQVAGVNNCAQGHYSNEISAVSSGGVVEGIAEGFVALEEEGEALGVDEKDVLGTEREEGNYYWWWIPLLVQFLLTSVWFTIMHSRKQSRRYWWSLPLIISVLSQIIHIVFGYTCARGSSCSLYLLLNLGIVTISLVLYWLFRYVGKRKT